MATTGKIPTLGFKAGARRFLTLLGFSPNATTSVASSRVLTAAAWASNTQDGVGWAATTIAAPVWPSSTQTATGWPQE